MKAHALGPGKIKSGGAEVFPRVGPQQRGQ